MSEIVIGARYLPKRSRGTHAKNRVVIVVKFFERRGIPQVGYRYQDRPDDAKNRHFAALDWFLEHHDLIQERSP